MRSKGKDIDGGWAWPVLLASYFNLLVCSGLAFVAGMFQVVFLEEFQESVALTSWITALFSSQMQLAGPLSSLLSNQFSCRVSVMAGGVCLSLGLALSSLVTSLPLLFITFGLLAGLGLGFAYSASVIVVNYYFDQRRTLVTGIALSASGLGIVLTPQASTILFSSFHWRESLVILSAVSAQMCVFAAILFPMHERNHDNDCSACTKAWSWAWRWWKGRTDDVTEEVPQGLKVALTSCDQGMNPNDQKGSVYNVTRVTDLSSGDDRNVQKGVGPPTIVLESTAAADEKNENRQEEAFLEKHLDTATSFVHNVHVESGSCHISHRDPLKSEGSEKGLQNTVNTSSNHTFETGSKCGEYNNHHKVITPRLVVDNGRPHISLTGAVRHDRLCADKAKSHDHLPLSSKLLSSYGRGVSALELSFKHSLMALNSPTRHGSNPKVIVVSRNPSLLSVVASIKHLNVTPETPMAHDMLHNELGGMGYQSKAASHHSLLDQEVIIPGSRRSSLNSDCPEEMMHKTSHSGKDTSYPPLLKNVSFWVLCIQLFLANCACGVYNIHLPSFAFYKGLDQQDMTNALSVNGAGVFLGRCLVGALANVTHHDFLIYWALHILGGIVVALYPLLAHNFRSMAALVMMVALYFGSVYSVLTSITIRCVGLAQLATAFGLEMVAAGLGYLLAPPLAGLLVDWTGSYDYDMYCGGALLILSSLVLMVLPVLDAKVIDSHDHEADDTSQVIE